MQAGDKNSLYSAQQPRSLPVLWVVAAAVLLLSSRADGTEYVGLWKIDAEGDEIALSFPDNGLAGACVSLSGGEGEPGGLRIESQIVRGRFQQLSMDVTGTLPPGAPEIALLVGDKIAWLGTTGSYDPEPVVAPLGGNEFAIEAKGGGEALEPWEIKFCNMELAGEQFSLKFTSDCAGFDFEKGPGKFRIIVDEDWSALGREMAGGMALFEPFAIADDASAQLTAQSSFPGAFFRTSVLLDGKPAVEPEPGNPKQVQFTPAESGVVGLVVRVTAPLPADAGWLAELGWEQVEDPAGNVAAVPDFTDTAGSGDSCPGQRAGGCSATPRTDGQCGPGLLLILALLVWLRMAVQKSHYLRERSRVIL